MRLKRELPQLSGYIPVSEAAKRLDVSKRRVYDYLDEGRLEGVRSGDIIMISEESIDGFKPQVTGRQRTVTPSWRMSTDENTRIITSIVVQLRPGQQGKLMERLQEVRRGEKQHVAGGGDTHKSQERAAPGPTEEKLWWKRHRKPGKETRH